MIEESFEGIEADLFGLVLIQILRDELNLLQHRDPLVYHHLQILVVQFCCLDHRFELVEEST